MKEVVAEGDTGFFCVFPYAERLLASFSAHIFTITGNLIFLPTATEPGVKISNYTMSGLSVFSRRRQ
jgi:hypothetical protein